MQEKENDDDDNDKNWQKSDKMLAQVFHFISFHAIPFHSMLFYSVLFLYAVIYVSSHDDVDMLCPQ